MSRTLHRRRRQRGKGKPRNKVLLSFMVFVTFLGLAGLSAVGYVVSVANSAPPLSSLKPVDAGELSSVYAADGTRLGFIQNDELRQEVPSRDLPQVLRDATVAIEDERFYEHKGVDYTGVLRAGIKNIKSGKTIQGGSTITMQLIRNLYISPERTWQRKLREAKLAEELENNHPGERGKNWILTQYLNNIPYGTVGGQTAIGVQAAARMYFGKRARQLKLHEAALLAGLPQAPSQYSPFKFPEKAIARRNEVLAKMLELRMITPEQADRAMRRGLGVEKGAAQYYRARRESYFFDYVKDELIKKYGAKKVKQGGMRIETSIDLKKQVAARQAIRETLNQPGDPSSAIVTIEHKTGLIRAMASSSDYGVSKFNLAAQGHRQPGSTFKIMTLMTALRRGVDPHRTGYVSKPLNLNDPRHGPIKTKTYDNTYGGYMNIERATLKSDNSVYMQMALDLGPDEVARTAKDMGIVTKLDGYPAESLGGLTKGVSPLEMARAYGTIANGGLRVRPIAVTRVRFPSGKIVKPFKPQKKRVFTEPVAYAATKILIKNIQSGTGTKANIGCPAGGKTGTTDSFNDAWFVGYTPRLVTSVWVGYPNAQIEMRNVHGISVAGGSFPAEIWGKYMKVAKGGYCGDFKEPDAKFEAQPFFGKYSKSGSSDDKDYDGDGDIDADDAKLAPRDDTTGGGNGTYYDPDLYEAPPQTVKPQKTPGATKKPGGNNGNGNNGGGGGNKGVGDEDFTPPQPGGETGGGTAPSDEGVD